MNIQSIKDSYKNHQDIYNIIFIALFIVIGFCFFKANFNGFFTDKGRELLFPQAILEGKVLYKDILCIYFPLSFQINALAYKIFGISISTLLLMGIINSIIISSVLYLITKEFLSRNISLLFAATYVLGAVFNASLFNLLLPYSTSFTYGISAFLIGVYLLIKYLKTENANNYLNWAYLFGGFALACKSEFLFLFFILALTSFILKPCSLKQNIKNIMIYTIIPIISFGTLFLQGLTLSEFTQALDFMHRFFTTDSMIYHIKRTGSLPSWFSFSLYLPSLYKLVIFYGISFILFKISYNSKLLKVPAIIAGVYLADWVNIGPNTILLPLVVSILLIFNIQKYFKDKILLVLILSALVLNLRMFWALQLHIYGMMTANILILALIVIIKETL